MGEITFLLGGARSGKSSYAVDLAKSCHGHVVYLATGVPCDEEMKERIEKHKNARPDSWETIEEPLYVEGILKKLGESAQAEMPVPPTELVLLDCLSFLVSNLLLHHQNREKKDSQIEDAVLTHISDVVSIAREIRPRMIIVSNEVGMGVVPDAPLGRLFRDVLGRANQIVADRSNEVLFFVAGLPIRVK